MNEDTLDDSSFLPEPTKARIIGGLNLKNLVEGKSIEFEVMDDFEEGIADDWDTFENSDNNDSEYFDFTTKRDKRFVAVDRPFEEMASEMTAVDERGYVKKKVIKSGRGGAMKENSAVVVHYQMFLEDIDEPFDSTRLRRRPQTFQLGESAVIPGLEIAVMSMQARELSHFIISWELAFGPHGVPPRIPPQQDILVELELLEVVEGNVVDPKFQDSIRRAKVLHISGNNAFKREHIKEAAANYTRALRVLSSTKLADAEEEVAMLKMKIKLHVNLAICFDKLNRPQQTCIHCREAFAVEPNNIKAIFQYGRANRKLSNFEKAGEVLRRGLKLQPHNKEIREELKIVEEKQSRVKEQEKLFWKRSVENEKSSEGK